MSGIQITRKAEYAISILVNLAVRQSDEYVSSKEIAAEEGIPVNLMPQIVSVLGAKGWVEAQRGPRGGVRLSIDPRGVSLREVIEEIEGPIAITRCLIDTDMLCRENCVLREVWGEAQTAMLEVLDQTTIQTLASRRRPQGPEKQWDEHDLESDAGQSGHN